MKVTDKITITNEDNMLLMARYPDNYFDLAIVDPPYGSNIMGKNKLQRHGTTDTSYRNKEIPSKEYFEQLYRISKNQIIWGAQYMMEHLVPGGSFIVWDKGAEPKLHNMSACDIAYFSKRTRIERLKANWCGAVKCEREPTIHIHQKPVLLYKWLLDKYATPGDKILDTHLGSGSIAIACHDYGYELTACELDHEYYINAIERLQKHTNQLKLFAS